MPSAATMEEWDEWHEEARRARPLAYFIANDLPKAWSRFYRSFIDRPFWWVKYRTTHRFNVIKPRKLKPGYHENDTRLIHGMFQILVDYVEKECSCLYQMSNSHSLDFSPRRHKTERNAEDGLKYLDWAAGLDDPSLPPQEQNPSQAHCAREVKDLYIWWTKTRPEREDPDKLINILPNTGQVVGPVDSIREYQLNEDKYQMKRLVDIMDGLWS